MSGSNYQPPYITGNFQSSDFSDQDRQSIQSLADKYANGNWTFLSQLIRSNSLDSVRSSRPGVRTTSTYSKESTSSATSMHSSSAVPHGLVSTHLGPERPHETSQAFEYGPQIVFPTPTEYSGTSNVISDRTQLMLKQEAPTKSYTKSASQGAGKTEKYFCTYCPRDRSVPTFVRSSDWKAHETKKHESERLWACPHRNCQTSFIERNAILKHHKDQHPSCRQNCQPKRNCSKRVFGCGFLGCSEFFEDDPSDSPSNHDAWYRRCQHVISHFNGNDRIEDWDYSTMIANLLRQSRLHPWWSNFFSSTCDQDFGNVPAILSWNQASAEDLRAKLETSSFVADNHELREGSDPKISELLSWAWRVAHWRTDSHSQDPRVGFAEQHSFSNGTPDPSNEIAQSTIHGNIFTQRFPVSSFNVSVESMSPAEAHSTPGYEYASNWTQGEEFINNNSAQPLNPGATQALTPVSILRDCTPRPTPSIHRQVSETTSSVNRRNAIGNQYTTSLGTGVTEACTAISSQTNNAINPAQAYLQSPYYGSGHFGLSITDTGTLDNNISSGGQIIVGQRPKDSQAEVGITENPSRRTSVSYGSNHDNEGSAAHRGRIPK